MLFRGLISLSVGLGEAGHQNNHSSIVWKNLSQVKTTTSNRGSVGNSSRNKLTSLPSPTHLTKQFSIFVIKPFYHLRASETFEMTWTTAF